MESESKYGWVWLLIINSPIVAYLIVLPMVILKFYCVFLSHFFWIFPALMGIPVVFSIFYFVARRKKVISVKNHKIIMVLNLIFSIGISLAYYNCNK